MTYNDQEPGWLTDSVTADGTGAITKQESTEYDLFLKPGLATVWRPWTASPLCGTIWTV